MADKVLIVDDDPAIQKMLEKVMNSNHLEADIASDGRTALEMIRRGRYQVILLDINMGDIDGFEVIKKTRSEGNVTPIIIISGRNEDYDALYGLSVGADDYITKPFDGKELVSRIQAVIRRSKGHAESVIKIGRMTVNLQSRRVEVDGNVLHLTGKEYSILELLCLRKGATLTKDMFLNHLYGGMDEPELKIIDVFVCKLRKKLMDALGGECYIETIWGRGYTIKDIDSQSSEKALNSPHELNAMSGVPGTI